MGGFQERPLRTMLSNGRNRPRRTNFRIKIGFRINHEVYTSGNSAEYETGPPKCFWEIWESSDFRYHPCTFVDLNIYHIQFNVVSSELLRAVGQN